MTLYLRVLLDMVGYQHRSAALSWSMTAVKWLTTIAVWGIFTGLTLFVLLIGWAGAVRAW